MEANGGTRRRVSASLFAEGRFNSVAYTNGNVKKLIKSKILINLSYFFIALANLKI